MLRNFLLFKSKIDENIAYVTIWMEATLTFINIVCKLSNLSDHVGNSFLLFHKLHEHVISSIPITNQWWLMIITVIKILEILHITYYAFRIDYFLLW